MRWTLRSIPANSRSTILIAPPPLHRDLSGFDFGRSCVVREPIAELASLGFIDDARNILFIGGSGKGRLRLATAIGVPGISRQGRRGPALAPPVQELRHTDVMTANSSLGQWGGGLVMPT